MKTKPTSIFFRKMMATLLSTYACSLLVSVLSVAGDNKNSLFYSAEANFISALTIFFCYIGVIILIYGNVVSAVVEYIQKRYFPTKHWLYVIVLGIAGLPLGVLFPHWTMYVYGAGAALLYAGIDKWLEKSSSPYNQGWSGLGSLILLTILLWGVFFFVGRENQQQQPFTKEEAVQNETSVKDTVTSDFPKKVGKWQGTVKGYAVTRETSVDDTEDKETYDVHFTETWHKGNQSGTWQLTYRADRASSWLYEEKGEEPPYHKK